MSKLTIKDDRIVINHDTSKYYMSIAQAIVAGLSRKRDRINLERCIAKMLMVRDGIGLSPDKFWAEEIERFFEKHSQSRVAAKPSPGP